MKKREIQLIITIGLIFIFIFIVIKDVKVLKLKKIFQKEVSILSEKTPEAISEGPKVFEKREGWGRDPFVFSIGIEGAGSALGDLHLNGIVWDAEVPYAIINNEVVKVGDMLGQSKVVEITKDEVILEENGERFSLRLEAVD